MSRERKIIGFDRKIRLDWLDRTAEWAAQELSPVEIRACLDGLLDGEVAGTAPKGARDKTKAVLLHIWGPDFPGPSKSDLRRADHLRALRDEALILLRRQPKSHWLALHWGMCLATYPFFYDLVVVTGRLSRLQATVSLAQITRRMAEAWGERSTLIRAVQRVVRSLVDWEVLQEAGKPGVYGASSVLAETSTRLGVWLLEGCLLGSGTKMSSLRQLMTSPALFPFSLNLSWTDIRESPRLEILQQGLDDEVVTLRDYG